MIEDLRLCLQLAGSARLREGTRIAGGIIEEAEVEIVDDDKKK